MLALKLINECLEFESTHGDPFVKETINGRAQIIIQVVAKVHALIHNTKTEHYDVRREINILFDLIEDKEQKLIQ